MIEPSQHSAMVAKGKPLGMIADPMVWRWYADLSKAQRLVCDYDGVRWGISIDGRQLADEAAFDTAVHRAYAMTRALSALHGSTSA